MKRKDVPFVDDRDIQPKPQPSPAKALPAPVSSFDDWSTAIQPPSFVERFGGVAILTLIVVAIVGMFVTLLRPSTKGSAAVATVGIPQASVADPVAATSLKKPAEPSNKVAETDAPKPPESKGPAPILPPREVVAVPDKAYLAAITKYEAEVKQLRELLATVSKQTEKKPAPEMDSLKAEVALIPDTMSKDFDQKFRKPLTDIQSLLQVVETRTTALANELTQQTDPIAIAFVVNLPTEVATAREPLRQTLERFLNDRRIYSYKSCKYAVWTGNNNALSPIVGFDRTPDQLGNVVLKLDTPHANTSSDPRALPIAELFRNPTLASISKRCILIIDANEEAPAVDAKNWDQDKIRLDVIRIGSPVKPTPELGPQPGEVVPKPQADKESARHAKWVEFCRLRRGLAVPPLDPASKTFEFDLRREVYRLASPIF